MVATIRREEFGELDQAKDPAALLNYLDNFGALAGVRAYKQRSFDLLEIGPGNSALDVGCGTGDDTRALAVYVGSTGRVVGVDTSTVSIAEAIKRSAGSSAPVEFKLGDAQDLPFPTGEFDCSRADRVFQHLENPERALQEMVRVTRPEGKVVVADTDHDTLVIDSPDRELTRQIVRSGADATRNGWMGRQLKALFVNAGLSDIEITPIVVTLTSFAIAEKALNLTGATQDAIQMNRITTEQAARWLDELRDADGAGRFFSSGNLFVVAGRKTGV